MAALVPCDGADLIALLWFAEGVGVADGGGWPALHCRGGRGHCSQSWMGTPKLEQTTPQ